MGGYKPYKVKAIGFIQPGVTTKDDIIQELGEPQRSLPDEKGLLLVYAASGAIKWFYGMGGGYSAIADTHTVSYRFVLRVYLNNDDTVSRTDRTKVRAKQFLNSKRCPAADLCYDRGQWMFLAPRDMERSIRESPAPNDLCEVFVYSDTKLFVVLDDGPGDILLNDQSFAHRNVSPGRHRIRRYETVFEFECKSGRSYFLRVLSDGGIHLVSTDIGRGETQDRRLILAAL